MAPHPTPRETPRRDDSEPAEWVALEWQHDDADGHDPAGAEPAGADPAGAEPAGAEPGGGPNDDGVLVLPWWQHPLNIVTMLVSIALVAGMIGWLIADAAGHAAGDEVDVGFLQDMREHHESAVGVSLLFLDIPDTRPGLRTVARSIVMGQSIEIGRMIQLLRDFGADEANLGDTSMTWMGMSAAVGSMPGIPTREQIEELAASSGETADRLFVDLMVAHHLGGLDMARFAAANAGDAEVRRFATAIMSAQQGEIIELRQLLDP